MSDAVEQGATPVPRPEAAPSTNLPLSIQASRFPHIRPPQALTWLVEALGVDDTLRLIEERGGSKFWVPKGVGNSSVKLREGLEAEFGKPMARSLIRAFGGGPIKVPLAKVWRIALYHAAGLSTNKIAIRLVFSVENVEKRLHQPLGPRRSGKPVFPDTSSWWGGREKTTP